MPIALSNDSFSKTYIQYLIQVQAVRRLPKFPQLDAVENRMLGILASRWHEAKLITVLEAMVMLPEISTSTAHRRLTALRKKGMIGLNLDSQDNRVKYVVPTKATHRYFAQLGQCMGDCSAAADFARQYLKYLHLTQEVRVQPIFQRMDVIDIAILDTWGAAWHNGIPMGVLKALSLINNRSAGRYHGRMHGLRAIGLIDLVPDDQDGRIKYVVPTKATQDYFAQLGQCMHQSIAK